MEQRHRDKCTGETAQRQENSKGMETTADGARTRGQRHRDHGTEAKEYGKRRRGKGTGARAQARGATSLECKYDSKDSGAKTEE